MGNCTPFNAAMRRLLAAADGSPFVAGRVTEFGWDRITVGADDGADEVTLSLSPQMSGPDARLTLALLMVGNVRAEFKVSAPDPLGESPLTLVALGQTEPFDEVELTRSLGAAASELVTLAS
jgi:hypothetical protein